MNTPVQNNGVRRRAYIIRSGSNWAKYFECRVRRTDAHALIRIRRRQRNGHDVASLLG